MIEKQRPEGRFCDRRKDEQEGLEGMPRWLMCRAETLHEEVPRGS